MQAISRKYPAVDDWMIWGEPNRAPNFMPFTPVEEGQETAPLNKAQQVAPHNYAELLDAAYAGVKAVDPSDRIIGGNTYTSAGVDDINPYQWIENLKLPDGSRPRLDMWGHNPFGFAKPDLDDAPSRKGVVAFGDLRRLTEVLDENFPGPPLKLFLAEWGVPEGFKDKDIGYVRIPRGGRRVDQGRVQDRRGLGPHLLARLDPPGRHRPQLDGPADDRRREEADLRLLQEQPLRRRPGGEDGIEGQEGEEGEVTGRQAARGNWAASAMRDSGM